MTQVAQLTNQKYFQLLILGKGCDRFSDSTLAYQGGGRGLDLDYLISLNILLQWYPRHHLI